MSTIIKHKEFTNHKIFKSEVAGRPLTIDVGKVAELASASAMVTYGAVSYTHLDVYKRQPSSCTSTASAPMAEASAAYLAASGSSRSVSRVFNVR